MEVQSRFDLLVKMLSLSATQEARLKSALRNFDNFIDSDTISRITAGPAFPQGSFAYGTLMAPLADGREYDVDLILPLDVTLRPEEKRDPDSVLRYVKSRLDNYPAYAGKVTRRKVCVRINYAGDFHLDIVPVHAPKKVSGPVLIPNRQTHEWELSNPAGYSEWVQRVNSGRARFKLTRTVKMLKMWREIKFAPGRAPPSIILTTLVGLFNPGVADTEDDLLFPEAPSDASFLLDSARLLQASLSEYPDGISLPNPSLPEEDLARDWETEDYRLFIRRLDHLVKWGEKAYETTTMARSCRYWQNALGYLFPD